jgi:hypothetical protein
LIKCSWNKIILSGICDRSRFWLYCLNSLFVLLPNTFKLCGFPMFLYWMNNTANVRRFMVPAILCWFKLDWNTLIIYQYYRLTWLMVFNSTFNNVSAISWWSVTCLNNKNRNKKKCVSMCQSCTTVYTLPVYQWNLG